MKYKDFEKAIGVVEGLTSPETKITNFKLSSKIIKLKRWYNPILEEYQAGANAINEKWLAPKTFGLNQFGGYLSGSKEDYDNYQKDIIENFKETKIEELEIEFTEAEFEGSVVNCSILSKLDDMGILK